MSVLEDNRPNWLLLALVTLSVAAHAFVLANMTDLFHHRENDYIELEVRTEQKSVPRDIPTPPPRRKVTQSFIPAWPACQRQSGRNEPAIESIRPASVQKVIAHPTVARLDPMPSPVAEPIGVPEEPDIDVPKIFSWTPETTTQNHAFNSVANTVGSSNSADEYLAMVRMRIERHKKYPMLARRRHMEGRVRLRFMLEPNGKAEVVEVVKGSGYRILDQAAVAAIMAASPFPRPPGGLFRGPVPLEITMVFELM